MPDSENLDPDVKKLVEIHDLEPHPEGGFFRRLYVHETRNNDRPLASAILYLLHGQGESMWHRLDADEIWCWHAGSPLELHQHDENPLRTDVEPEIITIGNGMENGSLPQAVVPARRWQRAHTPSGWALVSCVVVPAFTFSAFEMAY